MLKETESSKTAFRVEVALLGLLLVLTFALFAPVLAVVVPQRIDYGLHLLRAQELAHGLGLSEFLSTAPIPNFLYEMLVVLTYLLFPDLGILTASYIVALAFYVLLALVIFLLFRLIAGGPATYRIGVLYVLLTLALMLVAPIILLTPDNLYFGYVTSNAYHSPSMVLLKPFAVLQFYFAVTAFTPVTDGRSKKRLLLVTGVTVLSTLAKPSFTIVLLPALAVRALFAFWKKEAVNWWLLIGGMVLPAVAILGTQSAFFDMGTFSLAPLDVFREWAAQFNPNASHGLALKFILSVLFPLAVYVLNGEQARRTRYLNFAWLCFGFGAAYTYLFIESNRVAHGNFTWSGQIGLFILFVASLIFFLEQNRRCVLRPAFILGISILALHLVSGIVWYWAHVSVPVQELQWNLW